MKISTKGRYSLEAVLYLAMLPRTAYASVSEIAKNTGLSEKYLEQLLMPLRRDGFVTSVRGSQGGYCLASAPSSITVLDILRCAEGSLEPVSCIETEQCSFAQKCITRRLWIGLYDVITTCASSITLKDMAAAYGDLNSPEYDI